MTVLSRWEPFRELSTMQDLMNRMSRLSRESHSPEGPEDALTTTSFAPPVDIYEDEHNITLKLEVPGIDENDIDVRIDNNTLTVHGERKLEKDEKEENFRRVERHYGSFTRSFTLPSSVDTGQVSADYAKGVLKIKLDKKADAKPKQIKVNIGSEDPRTQGSREGRVEPAGSEGNGRLRRLPLTVVWTALVQEWL
jgi:HSP20 family protein